jgi:nitrosocyanin
MKFFVLLTGLLFTFSVMAQQTKRTITLVNYENATGTKQWLPGTIIVKKGDLVELTLINDVPSGIHGFFIPDFKVRKEVKKGAKEVVTFTADKEGLFEMKCHMHPAHVGGQLLVMP